MKILDKKNKIYLLDENNFDFPTLEMMNDDLVAVGGDFHPQRLINAYENGLFPWFIDDYGYINWYSPQKRMVLKPDEMKISKSLKKSILNKGFVVKFTTPSSLSKSHPVNNSAVVTPNSIFLLVFICFLCFILFLF